MVPDLLPALPELFLALAALALLLVGVLATPRGEGASRPIAYLAIVTLVATIVLLPPISAERVETFGGLFVSDGFASFMKVLILAGGAASLLLSVGSGRKFGLDRFEFSLLVLFASVGMMAMISANDLISLYVGFELQSLPLYVMAAFRRDTVRSTEAGLKYFVLGALSSGMLLFGISLVYGFGGTTNFVALHQILNGPALAGAVGLVIGIVFVSVGLAFKCSAVPFHMWTPDVYEGAPTPVTAFFAVAPKTAAIALFVRVMIGPLGHLAPQWGQIVWAISLLSMILGAYAAISQTNVKRLMAYSSIGHVGYALMGLAADSTDGILGVLVYMGIYLFMTLGAFSVILCMERQGRPVEAIADLAGLSRSSPLVAASLAIFMFALAGVPPLFGFVSKMMVFLAAIHAELYVLATIGVLTSVIGGFYYIRIVKLMYFDDPAPAFDRGAGGFEARLVMTVTALATLLFILWPAWLVGPATTAAHALFPG